MSKKQKELDRREFLKTTGRMISGAALAAGGLDLLSPGTARVALQSSDDDQYDFLLARVKAFSLVENQIWASYPGADRNLLEGLNRAVRCKVRIPPNCKDNQPAIGTEDQFNAVVDLTDTKELRRFPFLFMTPENPFVLSETKRRNLKQYLLEGGFLLMDDCAAGTRGDLFYQCSCKILEEMFGSGSVRQIPLDHEIFHNVYDFRSGVPYVLGGGHGAVGVFIGGRIAVFLSSSDIHCGWYGYKNNQQKKRETIAMGINIIMYSLSH